MRDFAEYMPKQTNKEKALGALLECNSIRDAAKACRLSEATLYRYLKEREFMAEYRTARRQTVENAISQIQRLTANAVDTLQRNLYCEQSAVEVRCAQIILDTAIMGVEKIDILERLETLENEHRKKTEET